MINDQRERPSGPIFCSGFSEVRKLEREAIERRWAAQKLPPVDARQLSGIAVSGGGIRSASFSLGVVQKLAHEGLLKDVHYLSTVSGGGYMGASLTWYLSRTWKNRPCYDTSKEGFPFLGGQAASNRRRNRASPDDPQTDRPPPDGRTIIDFIRQRSSYLVPGRGLGLLSAFGIVLRSIIVSLFAYFLLFTLLSMALIALAVPDWKFAEVHLFFWIALVLLALIPLSAIAYSLVAPSPWIGRDGYRTRRGYQWAIGKGLGGALVLGLFGLWLMVVTTWAGGGWLVLGLPLPATAGSATLGGALLGMAGKKLADVAPRLFGWLLPVLPPLALFLLLTGLGALGWYAATMLGGEQVRFFSSAVTLDPRLRWLFLGFALLYLFYANTNLSGLHRFYRDRLMETFMPDLDDVHDDKPSSRTDANTTEMWQTFDRRFAGPYHLVNANLVLLDSAHARYRSRKSDSFVLAPHFCGSEATGWAGTDRWLADRGLNIIRPSGPMTLATAMAISGAAVNPNTGADGRGVTKTASVSALLTMLNVRLGYWASSPRRLEGCDGGQLGYPPNFIFPGLVQGIFGAARTEKSSWLELTDGGHFDNTGLYELVRRRVKTIYVIDGTEDSGTSFSSFANVAEKIYIDFNVRLKFEDENGFIKLMRGADAEANPRNKAFQLAERGFAVGSIEYPALFDGAGAEVEPALTGILYYVKATLTKGLPEVLYSYRADNERFPWQSTADQFFDEQQFEAYRTLRFALASQLTTHFDAERKRPSTRAAAKAWREGRGRAAGRRT